MAEDLRTLYHSYFDVHVDIGAQPELLAASLRLRYQVYCVEQGYEDAAAFPDGEERDCFDARAVHSLLIHRHTGLVAGTARLIPTDPEQPIGSLPFDHLCHDPRVRDERLLPRRTLAEVSRFSVSKEFRRRASDAPTTTGVGGAWHEHFGVHRRIPHMCLGLAQAIYCASARHGITHLVAEMEPALLRMFRSLGLVWHNLGPVIDFHGRRQPCYACLDEMLDGAYRKRRDVWDLVTNGGAYHRPSTPFREPAWGVAAVPGAISQSAA